jgi:hypothetical protein
MAGKALSCNTPSRCRVWPSSLHVGKTRPGSFANIGDQVDEHGACEFVNAAGDKFFGLYARKGDAAKAAEGRPRTGKRSSGLP